jgi:methionyl-tRNA formyltransferase
MAVAQGARLMTPESVNAAESIAELRNLAPDVIVVVAYGQILSRTILGIPPMGCVNLHASLLPLYRGAAPIQWAIANGESRTGVTTMMMNEKMDDGDILLQEEVGIAHDETAGELHERLAMIGAELLLQTLDGMLAGTLRPRPQDRSLATFAPKLRKDDGRIDWTRPHAEIYNRIRAFDPWPGSFCAVGEEEASGYRLNVLRCRPERTGGVPGVVLECGAEGPLVAAGSGSLRLLAVQPEGRQAMDGADFLRGYRLRTGDKLG